MSLEGRVALVTGGGRGIGRAIALALARDGADVAVNYRRDDDAASETVSAIRALGRRAQAYRASVDDWDADQAMVGEILREFDYVDILVNNAGIASRGQNVADTDPPEMERVVRTHAFSAHYLSKLVIPSMRERPRGDIVMISSVATIVNAGWGAPYNMGKAALEALAFSLYKEERQHGIHVNIVAPGLVDTEMTRALPDAIRRAAIEEILIGRAIEPSEIAETVLYLASPLSKAITGALLPVDGGQSLG